MCIFLMFLFVKIHLVRTFAASKGKRNILKTSQKNESSDGFKLTT